MILQGLLIVLVILICANIGLSVWYKVSPTKTETYFDGVHKINKNTTKFLSNIPNKSRENVQQHNQPENKNGYISNKKNLEPEQPKIDQKKSNVVDPHIATMIDSLFNNSDEKNMSTTKTSHKLEAEFETRMEGIRSRPGSSCSNSGAKLFSTLARDNTEREEYCDIK